MSSFVRPPNVLVSGHRDNKVDPQDRGLIGTASESTSVVESRSSSFNSNFVITTPNGDCINSKNNFVFVPMSTPSYSSVTSEAINARTEIGSTGAVSAFPAYNDIPLAKDQPQIGGSVENFRPHNNNRESDGQESATLIKYTLFNEAANSKLLNHDAPKGHSRTQATQNGTSVSFDQAVAALRQEQVEIDLHKKNWLKCAQEISLEYIIGQ